jgi:hypothetical protein
MRRRLTKEEREIREGRGIPFARWWPIGAMILAAIFVSMDSLVFERCFGTPLGGGRGAGMVRMIAAIPCSPFLLGGYPVEWLLFIALWLPLPFAIRNRAWVRRHKAHWDEVRQREKLRRIERRQSRARAKSSE